METSGKTWKSFSREREKENVISRLAKNGALREGLQHKITDVCSSSKLGAGIC